MYKALVRLLHLIYRKPIGHHLNTWDLFLLIVPKVHADFLFRSTFGLESVSGLNVLKELVSFYYFNGFGIDLAETKSICHCLY